MLLSIFFFFFFFNAATTTEIYTLSLHDALPISGPGFDSPYRYHLSKAQPVKDFPPIRRRGLRAVELAARLAIAAPQGDRKSTRLNSSHSQISYAVFCLKKKKKKHKKQSVNNK